MTDKPFNMTDARRRVLRSARQHGPECWVVFPKGHGVGFEAVAWRKNCEALAAAGYLELNHFGDYYRTEKGAAEVVK